jgi:hypothetical protein
MFELLRMSYRLRWQLFSSAQGLHYEDTRQRPNASTRGVFYSVKTLSIGSLRKEKSYQSSFSPHLVAGPVFHLIVRWQAEDAVIVLPLQKRLSTTSTEPNAQKQRPTHIPYTDTMPWLQ